MPATFAHCESADCGAATANKLTKTKRDTEFRSTVRGHKYAVVLKDLAAPWQKRQSAPHLQIPLFERSIYDRLVPQVAVKSPFTAAFAVPDMRETPEA